MTNTKEDDHKPPQEELFANSPECDEREPYQALVLPYVRTDQGIQYCIFRRKDLGAWQAISGGGEKGEQPFITARREVTEETGTQDTSKLVKLSSISSIPVEAICGFIWGEERLVIPEYTFGIELPNTDIVLSSEHTTYKWVPYEEARQALTWDSNKTALWELNYRLTQGNLKE